MAATKRWMSCGARCAWTWRSRSSASAESEADSKLIDQIIANSTIKYPPVLVESEVEDDVKELMGRLEQQGVTVPEYLERIGKTQDQLVSEIHEPPPPSGSRSACCWARSARPRT